jgi:ATP-dependent Lon protease
MKESATIALEYIKANAQLLDWILICYLNIIFIYTFQKATPKDGPSAGIAMLTSLVSVFTQKSEKHGNDWWNYLKRKKYCL